MWNHAYPDMWPAMTKYGVTRGDVTPIRLPTCSPTSWPRAISKSRATRAAARPLLRPNTAPNATASHRHRFPRSSCEWPSGSRWADPIVWRGRCGTTEAQDARRIRQQETGVAASDGAGTDRYVLVLSVRNLPGPRSLAENSDSRPRKTARRFQSKGCNSHTGERDLQVLLKNPAVARIAADMWDHQSDMKPQPPTLAQEEMRRLLGYLWARQYFQRQWRHRARQESIRREELCHVPQ